MMVKGSTNGTWMTLLFLKKLEPFVAWKLLDSVLIVLA